ncbi:MAG: hypothetical protein ACRDNE_17820, partial [Gaiellaceae bacterium]
MLHASERPARAEQTRLADVDLPRQAPGRRRAGRKRAGPSDERHGSDRERAARAERLREAHDFLLGGEVLDERPVVGGMHLRVHREGDHVHCGDVRAIAVELVEELMRPPADRDATEPVDETIPGEREQRRWCRAVPGAEPAHVG